MEDWARFLEENGVKVYYPKNEFQSVWENGTEGERRELAYKLAVDYFELIKKSDVIFVYNPGGYLGNSTTLEVGCAYGCDKPVWALEKDEDDLARDVLFQGYYPTKEALLTALKE